MIQAVFLQNSSQGFAACFFERDKMLATCDKCGFKGEMDNDWSFTISPVKRYCPKCSDIISKKLEEAKTAKKKKYLRFYSDKKGCSSFEI